jgi:hypothetical protein
VKTKVKNGKASRWRKTDTASARETNSLQYKMRPLSVLFFFTSVEDIFYITMHFSFFDSLLAGGGALDLCCTRTITGNGQQETRSQLAKA